MAQGLIWIALTCGHLTDDRGASKEARLPPFLSDGLPLYIGKGAVGGDGHLSGTRFREPGLHELLCEVVGI